MWDLLQGVRYIYGNMMNRTKAQIFRGWILYMTRTPDSQHNSPSLSLFFFTFSLSFGPGSHFLTVSFIFSSPFLHLQSRTSCFFLLLLQHNPPFSFPTANPSQGTPACCLSLLQFSSFPIALSQPHGRCLDGIWISFGSGGRLGSEEDEADVKLRNINE